MSPIKGLTDQPPAYPQIGELRKGAEKPEKGVGADLEYFRFTSQDPEIERLFGRLYPGEPNDIRVYLPYPTSAENFEEWQEAYGASGLQHRCNGETCVLWRDTEGKMRSQPALSRPCPGGCKPTGRLHVFILDLNRLGTVTVLTTSVHDIARIGRALRIYEKDAPRGTLQGIPFVLRRRADSISTPLGNGKRGRRDCWLLSIEPESEWVERALAAARAAAMPHLPGDSGAVLLELPAPVAVANALPRCDEDGVIIEAAPVQPTPPTPPTAPTRPTSPTATVAPPPAATPIRGGTVVNGTAPAANAAPAPPTVAQLLRRYQQLADKAAPLGIVAKPLPVNATAEQVTALGKALFAAIQVAEAEIPTTPAPKAEAAPAPEPEPAPIVVEAEPPLTADEQLGMADEVAEIDRRARAEDGAGETDPCESVTADQQEVNELDTWFDDPRAAIEKSPVDLIGVPLKLRSRIEKALALDVVSPKYFEGFCHQAGTKTLRGLPDNQREILAGELLTFIRYKEPDYAQ